MSPSTLLGKVVRDDWTLRERIRNNIKNLRITSDYENGIICINSSSPALKQDPVYKSLKKDIDFWVSALNLTLLGKSGQEIGC